MSLSAAEKVRVVAGPRRARRPLHRGRLPELEPEGGRALRAARRASSSSSATVCAFGMTRRRERRAPRTTRRCATWSTRFAPVVDPRRQDLGPAPREGDQGLPRGEPGDDRRLGRLLPRPRASASSTTPSTSSTAAATTPATRSSACAPRSAPGAENVTLCDTNGSSLPDQVAEATAAVVAGARRAASRSASTPTTTPSARSPTRWPRSSAGARLVQGTINGYGERCGNANLVSILPGAAAQDGLRRASATSSSRR